ncbi:hypothetical protein DWS23_18100 [Escherichia coli]|nr:hypothetical protein [Escherichia coli]EFO1594158.1 hypothetical protein [Escherichia coli]EFO1629797.1 hypothetical protein [Escherichia coli]
MNLCKNRKRAFYCHPTGGKGKNNIADKGLSQPFQTKEHLFFPISGIDLPQRSQNLVNYHPIFCPNVEYCSFFV